MAGFHVRPGPGRQTDEMILTRWRNKHTGGAGDGDGDINIIIDVVYSDVYLKVYSANTGALVFDHSNR